MNLPELRPGSVKRWIAELPWVNVGKTGQAIFLLLRTLNQKNVSPRRRLAILEELRDPLFFVTDTLKRHYVNVGLPLPPRARRIVDLSCQMHREMALAYTLAAQPLLPHPFLWNRGVVAMALQRAMHHLGRCLLAYYQSYIPLPSGIWKRMHQLYFHAEKSGVHERRVEDPYLALDVHTTPQDTYKHALLLSLADPYHLHPLDIEKVDHALEQWARDALLRYPNSHYSGKGFWVDLQSDAGPLPLLRNRPLPPHARILDPEPLLKKLENMVQQGPVHLTTRQGADISFPHHLMHTLIARWGMAAARRAPRLPKDVPVTILVGLTAIHRSLETPSGEENPTMEIENQPISWSKAEGTLEWFRGRMVDEHAGGCRLRWEDPHRLDLRAGELIGIRNGSLKIGVIRWVRSNAHLEMGVQYLPGAPEPAWVKGKKEADFRPALWLPLSSYLLTLSFYSPGQTLTLRFPKGTLKAELESILEQTHAFFLFSVRLLSDTLEQAEAAPESIDEDIWSQL